MEVWAEVGQLSPPRQGHCLGGHSPVFTEDRNLSTGWCHHKHSSEKQRKHLCPVVSDPLSMCCFFNPGERPRKQAWESQLHPTPAGLPHHRWLAQVNTQTLTHRTSWHGGALPPLQSALISSSACAAEDNLEAMACSRTHCLSHTAIKCTSLSGCPVSSGQEGLSPS